MAGELGAAAASPGSRAGNGERVRAFYALPLPEEVRIALHRVGLELHGVLPAFRPTAVSNLHVTLVFLGDVTRSAVSGLAQSAEGPVRALSPFRFDLSGVGLFPGPSRPRILWSGVVDPAAVTALAAALGEASRAWLPAEDKPFRAHVTIGRFRAPVDRVALAAAIEGHAAAAFGRVEVREAVLFESRLTGSAPQYLPLARLPLSGTAGGQAP